MKGNTRSMPPLRRRLDGPLVWVGTLVVLMENVPGLNQKGATRRQIATCTTPAALSSDNGLDTRAIATSYAEY